MRKITEKQMDRAMSTLAAVLSQSIKSMKVGNDRKMINQLLDDQGHELLTEITLRARLNLLK